MLAVTKVFPLRPATVRDVLGNAPTHGQSLAVNKAVDPKSACAEQATRQNAG
ncbi:hypothetical protein QUA31_28080 [Microcoleus sp. Pol14D5]